MYFQSPAFQQVPIRSCLSSTLLFWLHSMRLRLLLRECLQTRCWPRIGTNCNNKRLPKRGLIGKAPGKSLETTVAYIPRGEIAGQEKCSSTKANHKAMKNRATWQWPFRYPRITRRSCLQLFSLQLPHAVPSQPLEQSPVIHPRVCYSELLRARITASISTFLSPVNLTAFAPHAPFKKHNLPLHDLQRKARTHFNISTILSFSPLTSKIVPPGYFSLVIS